ILANLLLSFLFIHTTTTNIYTLSLHDALPILTTNLLKFMRASIKMIGVSNLQSFIASMTQKLTLSDISDESKNYPKVLTSASWKDRKSGSAGMPRPISYAVFCLKKKKQHDTRD